MLKRTLSLALVFSLFALCLVGCDGGLDQKHTDGRISDDGVYYILNEAGDGYLVSGVSDNLLADTEGVLSLPSQVREKPVLGVADRAFEGCEALTWIALPTTAKTVGAYAFSGCSALSSFLGSLSELESIGAYAFENCTSLNTVSGLDALKSIGEGAFWGCTSLTRLYLPDGVTTVEKWLCAGCTALTSVTLSQAVTTIKMGAFDGCSSLENFTLPSGVSRIPAEMMKDCVKLRKLIISGNSLTYIDFGAFENCYNLVSISFYNGTAASWYSIYKGVNWDKGTGSYAVYCSNGTVYK